MTHIYKFADNKSHFNQDIKYDNSLKAVLHLTAPKEKCGVPASCKRIFQRQKVLALAIHFGTFYIFSAVRQ